MTYDNLQPSKPHRLSLSHQAQRYLRSLIETGTYQPGEQLPSQDELAAELGVSRTTLREALLGLEQEGIIILKHGVGTFVTAGYGYRLESGLERLESILELTVRQRLDVRTSGLEVVVGQANPEVAEKLQIPQGAPLTTIRRAFIVEGKQVAYMVDQVPATILAPDEIDESFDGSVLDLLRTKQDLHIARAVANIEAINADSFLVEKLKVQPQQALLLLEETLFDQESTAVEFSRNYFVSEFFHFFVVRR